MSLIIENNGIKAIELNGNGNGISNEIVSSQLTGKRQQGKEIKFNKNLKEKVNTFNKKQD